MYKAIYKIQTECLDGVSKTIFTPFIKCYHIHSVIIYANGIAQEMDVDFYFDNYKTIWFEQYFENNWSMIFDINYFYMRPDDIEVLSFLVDSSFINQIKSKEIISKHYIEGQFSMDNGLYKNAVLNFGTTLEGILNKDLRRMDLNDLIESFCGSADKNDMHFIRQLRNKVHPNQISATQDISVKEAVEARNKLEKILKLI